MNCTEFMTHEQLHRYCTFTETSSRVSLNKSVILYFVVTKILRDNNKYVHMCKTHQVHICIIRMLLFFKKILKSCFSHVMDYIYSSAIILILLCI